MCETNNRNYHLKTITLVQSNAPTRCHEVWSTLSLYISWCGYALITNEDGRLKNWDNTQQIVISYITKFFHYPPKKNQILKKLLISQNCLIHLQSYILYCCQGFSGLSKKAKHSVTRWNNFELLYTIANFFHLLVNVNTLNGTMLLSKKAFMLDMNIKTSFGYILS